MSVVRASIFFPETRRARRAQQYPPRGGR